MRDLLIVVTTWLPPGGEEQRRDAFWSALNSWEKHLKFNGKIRIHIADDGTEGEDAQRLAPKWALWPVTVSHGQREGVGASLNRGMADAHENEIVAYFVDDWQLLEDLDLDPWVKLFDSVPNTGFVRLGPPHPGISGTVLPVPQSEREWALRLDRHHYAFSFRPMLLRPQFWRDLGPFAEGESSLECERLYNERFCQQAAWLGVLALPHPFDHIYTTELSAMRPAAVTV